MPEKAAPLKEIKKIQATIQATGAKGDQNAFSESCHIEFIYGVGIEGLTPFEAKISDLSKGDEIQFSVKPEAVSETFGRLTCILPPLNNDTISDVHFHISITGMHPASDRDIVKAMAECASCGEGCCGNH